MKRHRIGFLILIHLLAFALLAPGAFAQKQPAPAPNAKEQTQKMTFEGKIQQRESTGEYIARSHYESFMIANQNPEVLGELATSKRQVSIEGRVYAGTELMIIDKLDGKPYQGAKKPAAK